LVNFPLFGKEDGKLAKELRVRTKKVKTPDGNLEIFGDEKAVATFLNKSGWNKSDIEDWYGISA
jgi:hypothetical protein